MYYVALCFVACFLPLLHGETKIMNYSSVSKSKLAFRNAELAAKVAVHYLNYQDGSPNAVYSLHELTKYYIEVIPDLGVKHHLQFEVDNKDSSTNVIGNCTAIVIFNKKNSRPYTNVNCDTSKQYQKDLARKDLQFYLKIMKQEIPAFATNIPGKFGLIDSEMMPFWHLATIGASYIMWEKSTERLVYNMARLQKMNQQIRNDKYLDFIFVVLLHEIPTQEIVTCFVEVIWYPNLPLNLNYHCVPEHENLVEGSGVEKVEGSAMEEGSAMI
uniref:Latexin n=1 Tax=Callorhinchus milii TaxID=7868 RepID=A0A4W3JYA7_CALMI|eukprot:gi/632934832/ref/XP_007886599.1/ PREDICTED: latexin-like [Callorhinchus milii]